MSFVGSQRLLWAVLPVSKLELLNNRLQGSINTPGFVEALQQLHSCGLTTFAIGGASFGVVGTISPQFGAFDRLQEFAIVTTNITGSIPAELGGMRALEALMLQGNYLDGTIPAELGSLPNLRVLNLGKNGFTDVGLAMHGPIPASFERLRRLVVLSLEVNSFSGALPPHMCSNMTSLNAVSLRNNNFSGSADQFGGCTLVSLDLADNGFSGPIPRPSDDSRAWVNLVMLRLSNNKFEGQLPELQLGEASVLSSIIAPGNQLTGTIPRSWTNLPWLSTVDLSTNDVGGSLPEEFAFTSRLTQLNLRNNPKLVGTISPWFRLAGSLQTFDLRNTNVNGSLPGITRAQREAGLVPEDKLCGSDAAGLARLMNLQIVNIQATDMAAKCGENNSLGSINEALPWYLKVDSHTWQVPLRDPGFNNNTDMECPRIIQREYCVNNQLPRLFDNSSLPSWSMSPSYYHYLGCRCLKGYSAAWDWAPLPSGACTVRRLQCSPEQGLDKAAVIGVSFATSVVGMLLLGYCLYVSWYGRWGLPKLKRAYDDIKKRRDGAPKSGRVSIVITDIESYSALMVAMPLIMGKAMSVHNNAMRKAAWTHYGFIIGQEGDSFIVAFREALDAVAFCLQVQQALMRADWPQELLTHQKQLDCAAAGLTPPGQLIRDSSNHSNNSTTPRLSSYSTTSVSPLPPFGPLRSISGGAANSSGGFVAMPTELINQSSSNSSRPRSPGPTQAAQRPTSISLDGTADSLTSAGTFVTAAPGSYISSTAAAAAAAGGVAASGNGAGGVEAVSAVSLLLPGLRVRMGVASGMLGDKEDCLNCKVLEVARVVSDAGSGGQVLLDSVSFGLVKDRLEELGQVGHSGYARSSRVTGWGTPRGWLARKLKRARLSAEAIVLDMGLYSIPGFGSSHALDAAQLLPDAPADSTAAAALADAGAATAAAAQQEPPAAAPAAAAAGCLRIYQILAPRLLERAHLYGNKLQLKPGSALHDLPFFAAPGTTSASLIDQLLQQVSDFGAVYKQGSGSVKGSKVMGSKVLQGVFERQQQQQQQRQQQQGSDASRQQEAAALTTYVFCSVILPAKARLALEPSVAAQVSAIVSRVLRQCLLALTNHASAAAAAAAAEAHDTGDAGSSNGVLRACGYMCREVGGDMKYLLVFHRPRFALEWCLLVQEALLWQDWPAAVLDRPGQLEHAATGLSPAAAAAAVTASAAAERDGCAPLLFRGPRIKMGVDCGIPQAVCPDHLGRADYHSNNINMAARYEAVCAQGGQILLSESYTVEVHQVGRFVVKGQPSPVDIVQEPLSVPRTH
ncbi:hypothetical protein OEZ85_012668 [Tetradesmus obliquus]|uniref:Guanylate cyclase domain-containing protein n=1 Tax=Tetradesmus obliquus TaxID=3088 RepID=A0ABY8U3X9_TETOB|nr:hypothetical protein OEZ85_012668 [Tetradesmus obliquus]